ncbi:MAG TPA: glycoside hydrolase family 2 TIM barrel-domain containing protein [Tepidisphaeraceae bacterium]|nr:glycoside hydrolase family 2 TIM barrel-domain containing protein [Tepidisphaeraceae bacterium]
MTTRAHASAGTVLVLVFLLLPHASTGQPATPLPEGVTAVWDLGRAWQETTPTRQRICVNGLWRWQPADGKSDAVPDDGWGYFKVPGSWPGITDYLQKDSQTVHAHPGWKDRRLGQVTAAWYQRPITVPAGWGGRRIALSVEYLNSYAAVFVDGRKAGELRFPAGEIDLSALCRPGQTHLLSLLVVALPLDGVMLSYSDTASARKVKGTVARRGLCGDVYLVATPAAARLSDVRAGTSVRRGEVSVGASMEGLAPGARYRLRARITDGNRAVKEFESRPFGAEDLDGGRMTFSAAWKPERLWDLHTPQNTYGLQVSLLDAGGNVVDTGWPVRFGFRELWIDGRDFYLNGTRVFLSALPLDNAQIGAASANYRAARQTLERLKRIGINCVYTHNYDCTPGAHLSFEEILRAADDVGMLVALSQPHFAHYDWNAPDADAANGYARHAAFYVRVAQNHPSVVFYATSHNATGYDEDMNPDLIGGDRVPRDTWSANNAKRALRAEAIVRRLDPARVIYHHAGGDIGSMYTVNFYPNFAPVQELNDWFKRWSNEGNKPLFLCEYGAPFTWDWTMYRGWYRGKREFGSAAVPWEFCLAEWDAQYLGDRAFEPGEAEKRNLRWEAKQYREGKVWHRWDYPTPVGSGSFERRNEVLATYLADNWRAYRTLGVSGISPWEYDVYWNARPGVDRGRKELKVDWDNLQRPGLSPDYLDQVLERMDTAFEMADWRPTAAGEALLRNNQPVLAYIAAKAGAFTGKDHNFRAGETVEKQLVVINNSRRSLTFRCDWSLGLSTPITGATEVTVETGQISKVPLRFELPATLRPGTYEIGATVRFGEGEEQTDKFPIHVLPATAIPRPSAELALFDPRGETAAWLRERGIAFRLVGADARPGPGDILIVGKLALTTGGPAPDVSRVRDGLRVILFEQSSDVLEKRLGFRVVEYGLRRVFRRIPDHPILAGIGPEHLCDWRGEATTVPPRLSYDLRPQHGPTVRWCDIPVSRVWRCGNRGSVASVLIEKPARGDFRPVLDGGYSLQYSPLMECRDGKGLVLFCQLDVTGRSESDPAAEAIAANLLRYVSTWKADGARRARYIGEQAGLQHLRSAGVDAEPYDGGDLSPDEHVLVVGPAGGAKLSRDAAAAVEQFVGGGGRLVGLGLDQRDVDAVLPFEVSLRPAEHIGALFAPPAVNSPLAGVGPADVHNRGPRNLPLVAGGATVVGNGVLAFGPADAAEPNVVLCQLVPWQLDYRREYNLKRTYRRASFTIARLLANLGVTGTTPLLDYFHTPPADARGDKRWLKGFYLDEPEEWDDPYRFFRW